MWPTKCPRTAGLKFDCFVQYCTFVTILFVCLLMVLDGLACLFHFGDPFYTSEDGTTEFGTCMGYGSTGGLLLVLVGGTLPCCYCFCFVVMGEGGRKILGVKSLAEVPA